MHSILQFDFRNISIKFVWFLILLFFLVENLRAEIEPNNTYQTANTLTLSLLTNGTINNSTDKIDWWILPETNGVFKIRFKSDKKVSFTLYGNSPTKSVASFTLNNVLDTTFTFPYTGAQYIKVNGADEETNYSLTATYVASVVLPDDIEPNNDTINSIPLEFGIFKEGNLGYITTSYDVNDYYSVSLPSDGNIELTVIYNDSIVKTPTFNGFTNSYHKGKYHYPVFALSEITDRCHYKIKAEFVPINEYANDAEPNNEITQATLVDIRNDITGRVNLMQNAKTMDAQDLFTFTLEKDTTMTLRFLKDKFLDGSMIVYRENSLNYIFPDKDGIIRAGFDKGKYYLKVFSSNYKGGSYRITTTAVDEIPIAYFDYQAVGYDVYFNEKVESECNFLWDFGDGATSTVANPVHRFTDNLITDVMLTVWNQNGKHIVKKQVLSNGISSFNPNRAGNKGYVTLKIEGRGFNANSIVKLTAAGKEDIIADSVKLNADNSLYCRFDLHNKNAGSYKVWVSNGNFKFESEKFFIIDEGGASNVWASITGRNAIRKGLPTDYTLSLTNSGNVDALGIPVFIAISEDAEIEFTNLKITLSKYAKERNIQFDTVPVFIKTNRVLGEDFNAKVYAFYFHYLPAGKTINRKIKITSDNDVKIIVWTNKSYFGSPMRGEVADCILDATAEAMTDQLIGLIPGASCAKSIYENVVEPVVFDEESAEESSVGSMIWDFATMAWDCTTSFFTPAKAIDFAVSLVTTIVDVSDFSDNAQDCYKPDGKNGKTINAVNSLDPNEKKGPQGYGAGNFINQTNNLPYIINFENKSTATAPAQEVFIADTLDTQVYDIERFSFTSFGFADTTIYLNGFTQNIIQDIDLRPKKELIVRFQAQLDKANGIANWTFRSFDPQTMNIPQDPYAGFLPPNNQNHAGEGFVSFNVSLNNIINEETTIANKASIVFDNNNPIVTNTYTNRLDFSLPESTINFAKGTENNNYRLEFSGNDKGAGIQYYRVYCSVNDSAYKLLKTTSLPIENFSVAKDKTVKLYSLAVDSLGYIESKTNIPDINLSYQTSVNNISNKSNVYIYPQPVKNLLNVYNFVQSDNYTDMQIFDMCGKCIINKQIQSNHNSNALNIDVSEIESGIYLLVLKNDKGSSRLLFTK